MTTSARRRRAPRVRHLVFEYRSPGARIRTPPAFLGARFPRRAPCRPCRDANAVECPHREAYRCDSCLRWTAWSYGASDHDDDGYDTGGICDGCYAPRTRRVA